MSNNSSIDLTLTDVASDDHTELANKINAYYDADAAAKTPLAYTWERNQMMLDGKQWLVFNGERGAGGQWSNLKVTKANDYIPRPVTNYLFDAYQTLKAYIIKNKPRSKVFPNDANSYSDKMAAKLANLVLEANWVRLKEQYHYETAAANLVAYGTVFKKSYWDVSAKNMIKVPKMVQVPITDPMTGMPVGMTTQQEVDPMTGDMTFVDLPLGDLNTSVIEPFRMALDPLAMHLHDARWVMEYSIQPISWIKETYSKQEEGYTGLADQVEEEKDLNGPMRKWFQLRTSAGTRTTTTGISQGGSSETMIENSAVVKEHYEEPTAQNPKGRLIVCVGDHILYSGPSPYEGPEMGDWHPYSECRWELTPGRFWGKSPLDAAVEIQKRINSIDSTIILTRKTSAVPQKLIPNNSGITPGQWTGRPNQEIFYRADGGAKPETIAPMGVDPSVMQERAQCVSDIKEITGAIDILKGDRPQGVNAASALNMLYEVGTGKLFPILDRWKCFVEQDQKKQLRIIHKFYKEPRPDYIRLLQSKTSEVPESAINKFIGTDLQDNCNVIVEAGSNVPKLQSAKQALLMELAQMGMLNLENPSNRVKFQQDLGISGYDGDIEPDRRRAEWENDILDETERNPNNKPVVLQVDNHNLHIEIHSTRMKSPAFMSLPSVVQQAYMQHLQEHHQFQEMAAQAQMLQQMAMEASPGSPGAGGPPPAPQGPTNPPAGREAGSGKGLGKDMKNAVMGSDVLTPASLGSR